MFSATEKEILYTLLITYLNNMRKTYTKQKLVFWVINIPQKLYLYYINMTFITSQKYQKNNNKIIEDIKRD